MDDICEIYQWFDVVSHWATKTERTMQQNPHLKTKSISTIIILLLHFSYLTLILDAVDLPTN
jgi:hypothetical protein